MLLLCLFSFRLQNWRFGANPKHEQTEIATTTAHTKKKHPKQHTMFIKLRRKSTKINSFHCCCCCCCYCFCCFFVCFLCPNVQLAHQNTKFNGCAKFSFVLQAFASVKKIDRMRRCGGKKKSKDMSHIKAFVAASDAESREKSDGSGNGNSSHERQQ